LGFLKKLKNVAEKGIEKGTELGTRGYDTAKDAAVRGYERAKDARNDVAAVPTDSKDSAKTTSVPDPVNPPMPAAPPEPAPISAIAAPESEAMHLLKLRLVKGEITKEQFEAMKKVLEE
jgi:hypothetical protein